MFRDSDSRRSKTKTLTLRRGAGLCLLAGILVGCTAPSKSTKYYLAHSVERQQVLDQCIKLDASDLARNSDCQNAMLAANTSNTYHPEDAPQGHGGI